MVAGDVLDPPPVQGVPDAKLVGVPAATAQPGPAEEAVDQAAGPPSQTPRVPATVAADAFDDRPQLLGRRVDQRLALVDVERATSPVGVAGQRVAGRAGGCGRRPGRGHLPVMDPLQGQLDGRTEGREPAGRVRDVGRDVMFLADDLVDEAFHQRPGDAVRNRCHQAHPVARQGRGQQGQRRDASRFQAGDLRVGRHHLPVGQDLRATDVEAAADAGGHRGRPHEIAQDVSNRDGLDPGVDPAGSDHDRKTFGEVAEHLE